MKNPFSLAGRKALVTGANTGLGQAIAVGLAAAGGFGCSRTYPRLAKSYGATMHEARAAVAS